MGGGGFRRRRCQRSTMCIEIVCFIRTLNTPSLSFLCSSLDRCLYLGLQVLVRRIVLLAAVPDDRPCEAARLPAQSRARRTLDVHTTEQYNETIAKERQGHRGVKRAKPKYTRAVDCHKVDAEILLAYRPERPGRRAIIFWQGPRKIQGFYRWNVTI